MLTGGILFVSNKMPDAPVSMAVPRSHGDRVGEAGEEDSVGGGSRQCREG